MPSTSSRSDLRKHSVAKSTAKHPLAGLHQSIGNRAVQRLIQSPYIQAKLQVSSPGDQFEQEADRVADTVMRMPDPHASSGVNISNRTSISRLHRKCTECEKEETLQGKRSAVQTPVIQRQCSQCQAGNEEGQTVNDGIESQVNSLSGGGQLLPQSVRAYFEPRFGHDFSGVRVHTGSEAAKVARSINAQAFTVGRNVAFDAGQYSPESASGQRLLAHELTHVVQQGGAASMDHGNPAVQRINKSGQKLQRVCGPAAIGTPTGCQPFGTVATEQIFSVPTERFLFTVNCNDFASPAERTRLRALAPGIPAADPVDIHGFASEEGDATYNARLACSRARRVRNELIDARTRAGLPPLNIRDMYTHGATAFGTRDINRSVVIPLARPPTIEIVPAGSMGPLEANQRRAAASCPIDCDGQNLGTMHAMGLFFHQSRGAILPSGDPTANGIGTSLHFTETNIEIPDTDPCHCDDYRVIQVLTTTHPAAGRVSPYVDNNGVATPFYDAVFLHGEGIHDIPAGYPDAGERVQSTISIYDRPFRDTAGHAGENIRWEAEACVACIKNTDPDRILGCATYGFAIPWNAGAGTHDPAVGIGPGCGATPSGDFLDTLRTDPTVAAYDFEGR